MDIMEYTEEKTYKTDIWYRGVKVQQLAQDTFYGHSRSYSFSGTTLGEMCLLIDKTCEKHETDNMDNNEITDLIDGREKRDITLEKLKEVKEELLRRIGHTAQIGDFKTLREILYLIDILG